MGNDEGMKPYVAVDYRGPEGPAMDRLQQRVRTALTAAGLPLYDPERPKPSLRVIQGGGGRP